MRHDPSKKRPARLLPATTIYIQSGIRNGVQDTNKVKLTVLRLFFPVLNKLLSTL